MDDRESSSHTNDGIVTDYLEEKYNSERINALRVLEQNGRSTSAEIRPDCKLVFNIPAFHTERRLDRALLAFLQQYEDSPQFEIAVLVNGPADTVLKDSAPYKQAMEVQRRYPELKINIYSAHYGNNGERQATPEEILRKIREDLLALTLLRAGRCPHLDIEKLLISTQDADLIQIADDYVKETVRHFTKQPETEAIAGFIDYPREDFDQDHLFFAVQLFEDILESKQQKSGVKVSFKGGNSVFRVSHLLKKQGFGSSFKERNKAPYQSRANTSSFNRGFQTNDDLWIVSSARRQMTALKKSIEIALGWRYQHESELSDIYLSEKTTSLPDSANKVTSDEFNKRLETELQHIYTLHKIHNAIKESTRDAFIQSAEEMGIRLHFNKDDMVVIDDIEPLKEGILKDFSRF